MSSSVRIEPRVAGIRDNRGEAPPRSVPAEVFNDVEHSLPAAPAIAAAGFFRRNVIAVVVAAVVLCILLVVGYMYVTKRGKKTRKAAAKPVKTGKAADTENQEQEIRLQEVARLHAIKERRAAETRPKEYWKTTEETPGVAPAGGPPAAPQPAAEAVAALAAAQAAAQAPAPAPAPAPAQAPAPAVQVADQVPAQAADPETALYEQPAFAPPAPPPLGYVDTATAANPVLEDLLNTFP
jgi:hypothetical protein